MAIGDVKTPQGLKDLNNLLADNSYVEGYVPSQADVSIFSALGGAPADAYPYIQRWYRHISSFDASERSKWASASPQTAGAKTTTGTTTTKAAADEDDDVDLFGSDEEEDAEAERLREERVAAYAAKKSKKPALIAKSSVLLDVKPWDDETDMVELEKCVRSVQMDGLVWGVSKLIPVGYGINKLQIISVIEDEKVSIDLVSEQIEGFEDYVQSVDIVAFNKI